jgi:nickel/cobalt exporter
MSTLSRPARLALAAAAAALALGAMPAGAMAHPMGNFSISVYSRLEILPREIHVRWVLDMAEIPSATTVKLIDANSDGTITEAEKGKYFALWVTSILDSIQLGVDGKRLPLEVVSHDLTLPSGEGGQLALRIVMDLTAHLPEMRPGTPHYGEYHDTNYKRYIGWREVVVTAGDGVQLIDSSAPTQDRTDELRTYPADLWAGAPTSDATFTVAAVPRASESAAALAQAGDQRAGASPSSGGPGFTLWPTGVLAALMVGGIAVWVALDTRGRGGRSRRSRRSR